MPKSMGTALDYSFFHKQKWLIVPNLIDNANAIMRAMIKNAYRYVMHYSVEKCLGNTHRYAILRAAVLGQPYVCIK